MDIVTLAAARKGSGGGASKEYVDEKVAALINDTTAAQDKTYSSAKVEEKVAGEEITTTSTTSPISTANGKPRAITIYGKSEVINGVIKSAGEGYAVVRLADLTWTATSAGNIFYATAPNTLNPIPGGRPAFTSKYTQFYGTGSEMGDKTFIFNNSSQSSVTGIIYIKDTEYTSASDFVASLGDATLCYELADPSQGNTIAIKADNGSGINGTMATFSTGTPLYGVSDTVRDVMEWNGSAGTVTKNCGVVDLGECTITYTSDPGYFTITISDMNPTAVDRNTGLLCPIYSISDGYTVYDLDNMEMIRSSGKVYIKNTTYNDAVTFKTAMSGVMLFYELAIPTTEALTQTENESIAGLRTYSPQTTVTINDNPEFEVEAYANTANGQAISDMQPTRSPLLTLSASGWTNNAQTVTFAHDTGKRNTIDVELANIKAWTAAGILATSETATSITFECDTVPTSDLSFRVTSMEVR